MNTNHIVRPTNYTNRPGVRPMSLGQRVALAAVGAISVGAALGLAAVEHTGAVGPGPATAIVVPGSVAGFDAGAAGIASPSDAGPATVPAPASSAAIGVSWCPPSQPSNPRRPSGSDNPVQPAAVHKCAGGVGGADGSVSGPDGGGTDPGSGEIDTGDAPVCVGDEIVCHQPF